MTRRKKQTPAQALIQAARKLTPRTLPPEALAKMADLIESPPPPSEWLAEAADEHRKRRGRPVGTGNGLTEVRVALECPALLAAAVRHMAEAEGVTVSEWWRRAARARLGWREVLEEE